MIEQVETPPPPPPAAPAEVMHTDALAEPEPVGITPEGVSGEEAKPITAPDSSILSERIDQMFARTNSIDERKDQEVEYERLKDEVKTLRTLAGPQFQRQYDDVSQKLKDADDDQSQLIKKLQKQVEEQRDSQEQMATRLESQLQEAELKTARNDVVSWVKSQHEFFPMLEASGQPELVFNRMMTSKESTGRMLSEAAAATEINTELEEYVHKAAPLLGYSRGEVKQEREEQVSINAGMSTVGNPLDRDSMTDDEYMEYLIRQHTG